MLAAVEQIANGDLFCTRQTVVCDSGEYLSQCLCDGINGMLTALS